MSAPRLCATDGCEKLAEVRGWCGRHYRRWWNEQQGIHKGLEQRFWEKVNKNGPVPEHKPELGPCCEWTGAKDEAGYGRLYGVEGKNYMRAHRIALKLFGILIPDGLEPDHLCRNRACVKAIADERGPAHLEVVTKAENVRRGRAGAAQRERTHCPVGHPYDEENTYRYANGDRGCRTCNTEAKRRYRAAA